MKLPIVRVRLGIHFFCLVFFSCLSLQVLSQPQNKEEPKQQAVMEQATNLISEKKPEAALVMLDQVTNAYEKQYQGNESTIYCASSQTESLFYLLNATQQKKSAIVLSSTWASAYYLKGYTLLEMKKTAEAKPFIEKALALSPSNARYLLELGHIYQLEKDWGKAMQTFKQAEEATEFSPPESKKSELGRALRGQGYVLVEQRKFADAEKLYRRCLELDPKDRTAFYELEYLRKQKVRQERGEN